MVEQERVVLELSQGLLERGHEVEVASWLDVDEYNDARYSHIARHFMLASSDYRWFRSIPRTAKVLSKIIDNFKPDLIRIHTPNVALLIGFVNPGIPCIHLLHGYAAITRLGWLNCSLYPKNPSCCRSTDTNDFLDCF